jgi:uncharacterized membrane protein YozB (DUF420 family)
MHGRHGPSQRWLTLSGGYNMHESDFSHDVGTPSPGIDKDGAASAVPSGTRRDGTVAGSLRKFLDRYFYFGMSLLVAAVVVFGFSHTIGDNLLHPDTPRPWILPIHAAVFSSWVVLFILQSALVRVSKVALHRRLGVFAATIGSVLPFLGLTTALVMQHWHDAQRDGASSTGLSLPLNDMLTFSVAFGLAVYWRRRPEFHRRLMLMATCCLLGAAFARFPENMVPPNTFYACVDLLIMLGVLRDLWVTRRVHAVYRYGLPCMMAGQAFAQYLMLAKPLLWQEIIQRVVQWTA